MIRSRPFVAVSVVTALSVALSSIASARVMTPRVTVDAVHARDGVTAVRWDGDRGDRGRHDGARNQFRGDRNGGGDGPRHRSRSHGANRDATSFRRDDRGSREGARPSGRRHDAGPSARQPMQFQRGPAPARGRDDGDRGGERRGDRRNHGAASAHEYRGGDFRQAPSARRGDHDIGGPPPRQSWRGENRGGEHRDRGRHDGYGKHGYEKHGYRPDGHGKYGYGGAPSRVVVIGRPYPPGAWYYAPPHRRYFYRNVWIVRPYGHWYHGYGRYYTYDDAYPWLAFTAVTLSILTLLTVAQQRAHEQAQIEATTAPVGSTIQWNESGAYGAVSVLRDGQSTSGRYCREFQQTVTIGGRSEQAYGTACMQPDGAWQIVDTR